MKTILTALAISLAGASCYAVTYNEAAAFIKSHEALRLKPYKCSGGKWTVGWGHVIKPGEAWMMKGITKDQAQRLFQQDMQHAYNIVTQSGIQNRDSALVLCSFAFNCGKAAMLRLSKNIDKLPKYVYAGGKQQPGLVKRRKAEQQMLCGIPVAQASTATPQVIRRAARNIAVNHTQAAITALVIIIAAQFLIIKARRQQA